MEPKQKLASNPEKNGTNKEQELLLDEKNPNNQSDEFGYQQPDSCRIQNASDISTPQFKKQVILNKKYKLLQPYNKFFFQAYNHQQQEQDIKRKNSGEEVLEGTFGVILKAQLVDTQTNREQQKQFVAIKRIKQTILQRGVNASTLRQILILKTLKNPYIVELLDHFVYQGYVYLVFPYIQNNLRDFMEQKRASKQLSMKLLRKLVRQLLEALYYTHDHSFMHRDIKPQNVLVTFNENLEPTIKLADWGSARKFNLSEVDQKYTRQVISLAYRPPELLFLQNNLYSYHVDIWSLGCIFGQLLFDRILFRKITENSILYEMVEKIGLKQSQDFEWIKKMYEDEGFLAEELQGFRNNDLFNYWDLEFKTMNKEKISLLNCQEEQIEQALKLLKKMLRFKPNSRITPKEALKDCFFRCSFQEQ